MAQQGPARNDDFKEVKFDINLKDMKNFKSFQSNQFFVRGNPWVIKLQKKLAHLSISLLSQIDDKSNNWVVVASCKARVISSYPNIKSHQDNIGPAGYYPGMLSWENVSFVPWYVLINPANGYVKNDECRIEFNIKATPKLNGTENEFFAFERFEDCCNDCSSGKFQFTIKKFSEFFGACTPELILGNFPWRLILSATENFQNENQTDNFLRIELHNLMVADEDCSWLCHATMKCKLVSTNPNVKWILPEYNKEYTSTNPCHALNLIQWTRLIDPSSGYVQDDSLVLEIKIKLGKRVGASRKRKMCDECVDSVKLVCAICLENLADRSVSTLSCGHMFCTVCIEYLLRIKKICPSCNQVATFPIRKLSQKVFLPKQ